MRLWILIGKDLLHVWRDRRALVVNLAVPLLLTAAMGLSFGGGLFGKKGISAIPLALVAEGVPQALQDALAEGLENTELFEVSWLDSTSADRLVRRGERQAAVYFPPGFLTALFSDETLAIQLWKDPNSQIKAGIVEQILTRLLAQYQTSEAAYLALWPDDYAAWEHPDEDLEQLFSNDPQVFWQSWTGGDNETAQVEVRDRLIQIVDHHLALNQELDSPRVGLAIHDKVDWEAADTSNQASQNLFDYFLPGMAVFFVMFGVAAGIRTLHRELDTRTFQRQLLTPVRDWQLVLGKWGGACLSGMLQLAVLFAAGALVFGVNLGPDPWSLPLLVVLCSCAAGSVLLLIAVLVPSEKAMDTVTTLFILASAMIGGNFFPVEQMPAALHLIGRVLFNYWANTAFNEVIAHDHGLAYVSTNVVALLLFTLVSLTLGLLIFTIRRRRGGLT